MKALVVYDSVFGNTEQIALAIGQALESEGDVRVAAVANVTQDQLAGVDLLVAGSPTRGFRPTPALAEFLKAIPGGGLKGMRVMAFDTRYSAKETTSVVLKLVLKVGDYAANVIAKTLVQKGGAMAVPAEGFIVAGEQGPLRDGELERAARWAQQAVTTPA